MDTSSVLLLNPQGFCSMFASWGDAGLNEERNVVWNTRERVVASSYDEGLDHPAGNILMEGIEVTCAERGSPVRHWKAHVLLCISMQ